VTNSGHFSYRKSLGGRVRDHFATRRQKCFRTLSTISRDTAGSVSTSDFRWLSYVSKNTSEFLLFSLKAHWELLTAISWIRRSRPIWETGCISRFSRYRDFVLHKVLPAILKHEMMLWFCFLHQVLGRRGFDFRSNRSHFGCIVKDIFPPCARTTFKLDLLLCRSLPFSTTTYIALHQLLEMTQ